ncbi:dihydropteroate synthase [Filimonas lacunae]|nr:dihydropteroate synthase [Filimonas lacunae]BAV08096.1 dihydropteroate synthase [Filimonas lacunae]
MVQRKSSAYTLNCNGRLLALTRPVVMGIINTTPDSFYSDSRKQNIDTALAQAEQMLADGATILDLGGQSTGPGKPQVDAATEAARVVPVIAAIHQRFPEAFISVDTYFAQVARESAEAGACIINDVSGGTLDMAMLDTVAGLKLPYVCMHMKGTTETMQQFAHYENVTREVLDFFIERLEACRQAGIHDVIIDPGFGFAKTIAHNFQLLKEMHLLQILEKPVLLGISRKSTIYKTLHITPEEALNGTTVLHTVGLQNGAVILRAHDVKEAMQAIQLMQHL